MEGTMKNKQHQILFAYINRVLSSKKAIRRYLGHICSWILDNAEDLGDRFSVDEHYEVLSTISSRHKNRINSLDEFKIADQAVRNVFKHTQSSKKSILNFDPSLDSLKKSFELDSQDLAIFGVFLHYSNIPTLESLSDEMTRSGEDCYSVVSIFSDVPRTEIEYRLSSKGKLVQMGLLQRDSLRSEHLSEFYSVPRSVTLALETSVLEKEHLCNLLVGKPTQAKLGWEDFAHLGRERDLLASLLSRAFEQQEKGINILLWGMPGTGKTEFSKTLAEKIGVKLYSIGESDDEGSEPNRQERLCSLLLAQSLMRHERSGLLLFDEIDDLLYQSPFSHASPFSKVFINRLFENNAVPTIWTVNDINLIDEAFLRRMSMAIHFDQLSTTTRAAILGKIIEGQGLSPEDFDVKALAKENISPAIVETGVRVAALSETGETGFKTVIAGLSRAMQISPPETVDSGHSFNPDLVNADLDLNYLTQRLTSRKTMAFSLCLYGAPGTGKSEFVRHLAKELEMDVMMVRASDLLGKYVGQTEKAISNAFKKAEQDRAFLIFDEADSLLMDRREAHQSWQVSQVNEMLTWMERHPFPFACTTNLWERLDAASLRRFTFKCKFDFLTPRQNQMAFRHFFPCVPPDALERMSNLTPGDFAVVSRKADILGISDDADAIIPLLQGEIVAKGTASISKGIGFANHAPRKAEDLH